MRWGGEVASSGTVRQVVQIVVGPPVGSVVAVLFKTPLDSGQHRRRDVGEEAARAVARGGGWRHDTLRRQNADSSGQKAGWTVAQSQTKRCGPENEAWLSTERLSLTRYHRPAKVSATRRFGSTLAGTLAVGLDDGISGLHLEMGRYIANYPSLSALRLARAVLVLLFEWERRHASAGVAQRPARRGASG